MSRPLISNRLRAPLVYVAMSLLVVWHTVAMVVAAAPESDITRAARPLFDPYLTLFRLDNQWGFFAPNVSSGSQFRYIVEDAAGNRQTFTPDKRLSQFHPTSIWFRDRYVAIMERSETFGEAAAAALCQEHAALRPVSVTLQAVDQKPFGPADRLAGKHPLDPEFVNVINLKTVPCSTR